MVDASRPACVASPAAVVEAVPGGPGIEIVVVDEEGAEPTTVLARAVFEVWTRNRIYLLDGGLTCLEVTCRDTGLAEAGSRCRGAQLVGCRRRVEDHVEFWRPLPVPGSVAIFGSGGLPSAESLTTSVVERVVVRQRVRRLPAHGRRPLDAAE